MGTESAESRRRAMVTGASSGIGIDFARQLAQQGFDLTLTARREDRLQQLKAELEAEFGIDVAILTADLATEQGITDLTQSLRNAGQPFHVWINNAGLGGHGEFQKLPLDKLLEIQQVNASALTTLCWSYLREFKAEGRGYLLNMGSFSAFSPPADYAVYAATKAYVVHLTRAIRDECRARDVWVSTLCPGFFASEFFAAQNQTPGRIINFLMLDSAKVARAGLKGLFRGKTVVVPGLHYRATLLLTRFLPTQWSVKIASWTTRY